MKPNYTQLPGATLSRRPASPSCVPINRSIHQSTNRILILRMIVLAVLAVCQREIAVAQTNLCDPAPAGIVGWWAAEGNANDSVGINHGTLKGSASFAPGEIGQAFSLDGITGCVFVPASPSLDVGPSGGFTIEGWVSSPTITAQQIIVEWHDTGNLYGFGVHMQTGTGSAGGASPGALYANVVDTGGNYHFIWSNPNVLVANQFQHVALTYDEASGMGTLYVNGALVAQSNLGVFTPRTTGDFYLGERPGWSLNYTGLLDEISLYNRALSADEIAAIYQSGSNGKCLLPPMITSQPASQTTSAYGTTTFQVAAVGSQALAYQWSFNGTNLANATNATLTLTGLWLTNTGNYSVLIANAAGATNSANATLTVVDTLDHFAWNPVPSPRFANAPFSVTIQAIDPGGRLFTDFTGTVALMAANSGVPVNPAASGSFVQGSWTGSLTISQTISNVVLQADDGAGHIGLANPINVLTTPSLMTAQSGSWLLIYWPTNPPGFVVESSTSLVPPQWMQVPNAPVSIANQNLELFQMNPTNQFYRLRYTLP
jgi:hypothetical protein